MPIEELVRTEVTLAAKRPQPLLESTAAIAVLTNDDIQHTGYTLLPDMLRMVPGVQVGQFDANKWAISARGFSHIMANKLQVLIDDLSVYTPLFSGVFWESQDVLFEDTQQIEVIRGPGASLWGANAVNGIINIITKPASETQGTLFQIGGGKEEQFFCNVRYGGTLFNNLAYRIYGKYQKHDALVDSSDQRASDKWDMTRIGMRLDWSGKSKNKMTVISEINNGTVGQLYRGIASEKAINTVYTDYPSKTGGAHIQWRWTYARSQKDEFKTEASIQHSFRNGWLNNWKVTITDINFQHRAEVTAQLNLIWGIGYRYIDDHITGEYPRPFIPSSLGYAQTTSFIQLNHYFIKDHVKLTLGSEFEKNYFSGWEIQPNLRMLIVPGNNVSIWGAISNAARTPSRSERDATYYLAKAPENADYNIPKNTLVVLKGNPNFDAEHVTAYEAGIRMLPRENVSVDISAFRNEYRDLRNVELVLEDIEIHRDPFYFLAPVTITNNKSGRSMGVEILTSWQPLPQWRMQCSYSYLDIALNTPPNHMDIQSEYEDENGTYPYNQYYVRSEFDILKSVQMDAGLRFVGQLPSLHVNRYFELDANFSWMFKPGMSIGIAGQNLLQSNHQEFYSDVSEIVPTYNQRSFYGVYTWHF
ncbi:TonB-dependent receptor [candidate division KSB1 bacterium]|nr:TonB-dependent receptor [candidate division KSB1 bacterium]